MANPSPSRATLSGGFLLAVCLIVGACVGAWKGQPSLGFVGGLGVGLVLVLAVWLVDRSRS